MKERENKRDDGAGRYRWRNSKWTAFYGALSQLGIQCLAQGRFSMTLLYPLSHWHLLTGWRLGACKDSWSHIACIICGVSARMTQSSQPSGESEQKTRTDGALIFFVKVCFFLFYSYKRCWERSSLSCCPSISFILYLFSIPVGKPWWKPLPSHCLAVKTKRRGEVPLCSHPNQEEIKKKLSWRNLEF